MYPVPRPTVEPNNLNEYLDSFRAAARFLVDAQENESDAAHCYQLWAEAFQFARKRFRRGTLDSQFIIDRELDILCELGVMPLTYVLGIHTHATYAAGLVHNALAQLSTAECN